MRLPWQFVRGFARLAGARLRGRRFPLNVFLAVTNRCNLDCTYCYGEYFHRRDAREFTLAEIRALLDELRRLGTVFLQLQGGEPFLRPDIDEIIRHAHGCGFNLDVITNGLLLARHAGVLPLIDSICLSLDGRPALNDRHRGPGAHDAVLAALETCRAAGVTIRLNAVITRETTPADLDYLIGLARERGLLLNFSPQFHFQPCFTGRGFEQFLPDDTRTRQLLDYIIAHKRRDAPIQFSARSHQFARDWPFSYQRWRATAAELPRGYRPPPCRHGDYVAFIDGDGRVYPCCNYWNDYEPRLNVHEQGLRAALLQLTRHDCAACHIYSYLERNALLNFSPFALANYFRLFFLPRPAITPSLPAPAAVPRRRELARIADRGRFLAQMLSIRALRRPPFPLYVNLVINSRCTLRCAYCFGNYHDRQQPDMPFADFTRLTDELHRRGTRFIMLQGGEPLLHPELGRMIGHLRRRGILVSISSNGQLPDRLRELPELELLDNLCFSLDGAPAGNDRVRGPGSHDRVLASLAEMRRRFTIPVRINSLIHRHVIGDDVHLAELALRHRFEWGVSFLFRGCETADGEPLDPAPEQVRAYLERVLAHKRRGIPIFTSTRALENARDWPDFSRRFFDAPAAARRLGSRAIQCRYGSHEIVIDENGDVYPCNAMQGQFRPGNLHRDGLDRALARLADKPCYTCWQPPLMNTSAMINWEWGVIGETIVNLLRFRRRARQP